MTTRHTDTFDTIDNIQIASPCEASWADMSGDERVRHCQECKLNVYNLSEMTRTAATALIEKSEGRVCVRLYRRRDGTVVTNDCPVGIAALKRRARMAYARAVALVGALFTSLFGCTDRQKKQDPGVLGTVHIQGEPTIEPLMGDVCLPQKEMGRMCPPEVKPGAEKK